MTGSRRVHHDPEIPEIRDELEQNQRWWNREYRRLVRETFEPVPFDESEHEGHNLVSIGTWADPSRVVCTECPERLIPRRRHDRG